MKITDDNLVESLMSDGVSLDRWVALGSHLVGYVDERGQLMAKIIEDDALAAAASAFLRRRGQVHIASQQD
ncbi:hypothetical protein [Variovorax sp. W2I14]|uniref:hypothetical protein n=1 Tax=Variovorax sp. W2I14 TaxID=3042290 RepID=UPI003D213ED3